MIMTKTSPSTEIDTVNAPDTVGYSADEFEFETVHTEAPDQIVFDTIGDTYIGKYLGQEVIEFETKKGTTESFTQLKFLDPQGGKVLNAGYDLLQAFKGIQEQSIVRIQLMKFVDVDQESPMKSYRVDVAKARS